MFQLTIKTKEKLTIGQKIKILMILRKMRTKDLIRKTKLSDVYICQISNDKIKPSKSCMKKISKALKAPAGFLLPEKKG